jgi:poly(ADP-ribose) glycohydrolase ARH3
MRSVSNADQFSGCLVGQCLGDALGFPVEGSSPDICASYVEKLLALTVEQTPPSRRNYAPGQYTDDSQLARELMVSYAELERFDPSDYARRIRSIFSENRIVGRGLATDAAAQRLMAGVPWEEAGTPSPQAGNGTAMRAGPVGLLFGDDPEQMIRAAHDQGRITHKDHRCSAGSVAIAGAVALAVRPGEIEVPYFVRQLSEWMQRFDEHFAEHVLQLTSWLKLPPQEAAPTISCCASADFLDDWQWISPFVIPSVLWSLYSFLRTPEDYWETVCTAILAGGDVDTTAAMAGAISGAHVGLKRLPGQLARQVNDQGQWGFGELVGLSNRCHGIKSGELRQQG